MPGCWTRELHWNGSKKIFITLGAIRPRLPLSVEVQEVVLLPTIWLPMVVNLILHSERQYLVDTTLPESQDMADINMDYSACLVAILPWWFCTRTPIPIFAPTQSLFQHRLSPRIVLRCFENCYASDLLKGLWAWLLWTWRLLFRGRCTLASAWRFHMSNRRPAFCRWPFHSRFAISRIWKRSLYQSPSHNWARDLRRIHI